MAEENDKRKVLIDSVKELLELKLSDDEIVMHLKDAEILEPEARDLISSAKGILPRAVHVPKKQKDTVAIKKKLGEEISEQAASNKKEGHTFLEELEERIIQPKKPVQKKQEPRLKEAEKQVPVISTAKSVDIAKLWEKGILSSVSNQLAEIKEIKQNLDKQISKKADEIAEKEIEKVQVLFKSQQDLFVEKINSRLDGKAKEVEQLIDGKIVEMKQVAAETRRENASLEKKRQEYSDFMDKVESTLAEVEKTKSKILAEMNSDLIKAKSSSKDFMDTASAKLKDMDDRVNKTMEVGLNVIEGLKVDAQKTLREMAVNRGDELNKEVLQQLDELKEIRQAFETRLSSHLEKLSKMEQELPKQMKAEIEQHVQSEMAIELKKLKTDVGEIGSLKQSLKDSQVEIRDFISSQASMEIKRIRESRKEYEQKMKSKLKELAMLQQAVQQEFSPTVLRQQISDLEAFKQQFIKVIETNVNKFNIALQEINQQGAEAENQINNRIKLIDSKVMELDEFEQQFAQEMGIAVKKAFDKKKEQKKRKKKA